MSHVQLVTGFLLVSAKQEFCKHKFLLKQPRAQVRWFWNHCSHSVVMVILTSDIYILTSCLQSQTKGYGVNTIQEVIARTGKRYMIFGA